MNIFDNDYFEVVYKFFLWFLLATVLASCSEVGVSGSEGASELGSLLAKPPSHRFAQLFEVVGFFFCGLALLLRNITRRLNVHTNLISRFLYALLSRIGSDLTLVPFGLMTFSLGLIVHFQRIETFTVEEQIAINDHLPLFVLIMAILVVVSLAVKEHDSNIFAKYFNNQPVQVQLSISLAMAVVSAILIFF